MSKYIDADTMIKAMPPIMEWLSKKAQTIDIDLADDGTLSVEVDDATKVKRVLVEDGNNGDLYYADRPQGEWIEVCKRTEQYDREGVKTWAVIYQCPTCGFVLNAIENHTAQYNYCPSCGARMFAKDINVPNKKGAEDD